MPRFQYCCVKCDFVEYTFWSTKREELDEILKGKCPDCGGKLEQSFGTDRPDLMPNHVIRAVSAKENKRREEKWHKKSQEIKHEERVSQDAYYDMRDD